MPKIKLKNHPGIVRATLYELAQEMTGKSKQAINKTLRRRGLACDIYGIAQYIKEHLKP